MAIEALADRYSIFSYLAAAHLKLPAEKGTYSTSPTFGRSWCPRSLGPTPGSTPETWWPTVLPRVARAELHYPTSCAAPFALNHIAHEYHEPSTSSQHLQREAAEVTPLRQPNAFVDYNETAEYLGHSTYRERVPDRMSGGEGYAFTACSESHTTLNSMFVCVG